MQKKQAQVQQAKYAAVHESRGHDDRRTAAELSARLQKLRTEHQDTAAQAASQLTTGPVSIDEGQEPLAPIKEKKPWPAKVWQTDLVLALQHITIATVITMTKRRQVSRCPLQATSEPLQLV